MQIIFIISLSLQMRNAKYGTSIPTKIIEDLNIIFDNNNQHVTSVSIPISTYETPLFASIQRGAKITKIHPVSVAILNDCMTRSAIFQCKNISDVESFLKIVNNKRTQQQIIETISETSNHCKLLKTESQIIGNLIYIRLSYNTCEAAGHNIATIVTNSIAKNIVKIANKNNLSVKYLSNSGNTCIDKKNSAINSISGRGKHIVAEVEISKKTCKEILHTTCEKIVELNIKKNLLGSILAGSLCSANAHFANMLAGIFLPLGQDIANIVEGSQGITYCELNGKNLYFSVNLPNIICGCIGNGKNIDFVKKNLQTIGCLDKNFKPVKNASKRLAEIIGAIVLCGELSLLAALSNEDELVKSHITMERKKYKTA